MPYTVPKLDFYREQYLRRLRKDGYPATAKLLKEFNCRYYHDLDLQGEKRTRVTSAIYNFNRKSIKKSILAFSMRGNPELEKMFFDVVADYEKKWMAAPPVWTPVKKRSASQPKIAAKISAHDDDTSAVSSWSSLLDASMDDTQKDVDTASSQQLREKISDLEKSMATQKKANEDLTRRMNAKDEEVQELEEEKETIKRTAEQREFDVARLEDELNHLHYQLNMAQAEAANQERAKQALEDMVRSLEEKNCPLELKNRSLEDKVRSLEELVRDKDQMLKSALKVGDTLSSIISKPTPQ